MKGFNERADAQESIYSSQRVVPGPAQPVPTAAPQPPSPTAAAPTSSAGVNKRYRPAPAKTFQCRGYGDCRMVFSRSEHLARHIRWVLCLLSFDVANT